MNNLVDTVSQTFYTHHRAIHRRSILGTTIRVFFSYHYVHYIALVWSFGIAALLQILFSSLLPAVSLSSTSSSLTTFIRIAIPSFLLMYDIVSLSMRVVGILADAMVIDGWQTRPDKYGEYMVNVQLEKLYDRKWPIPVMLVNMFVIGLLLNHFTHDAIVLAWDAELRPCLLIVLAWQGASTAVMFATSRQRFLNRDDFFSSLWYDMTGWYRLSAFGLVIMNMGYEALYNGLWLAVAKISLHTMALILPHVVMALSVQVTRRCVFLVDTVQVARTERRTIVRSRIAGWLIVTSIPVVVNSVYYQSFGITLLCSYCAVLRVVQSIDKMFTKLHVEKPDSMPRVDSAVLENDSSFNYGSGGGGGGKGLPRRHVSLVLRTLVIATSVIVVGLGVMVAVQSLTTIPSLTIHSYNKQTDVLHTEHLSLFGSKGSERSSYATTQRNNNDNTTVDDDVSNVICSMSWHGLLPMDYAWLSFLTYFNYTHDDFNTVFEFYKSHRQGDQVDDVVVKHVQQNRQGVVFYDFVFPKKNMSVIAVRGTDIGSASDVLQDVHLYTEVVIHHILSLFVPGFAFHPNNLIIDYVALVSTVQSVTAPVLGSNHNQWYWSELVEYVNKQKRNVVLTGHSLGGALAKIAAAKLKKRVVAFASPGTLLNQKKFGLDANVLHKVCVNVISQDDAVPGIDEPEGTTFRLPCSAARPDKCHLLEYMMSSLWESCESLRKAYLVDHVATHTMGKR